MIKGFIILLALCAAVNTHLSFLEEPKIEGILYKHFLNFIKQHKSRLNLITQLISIKLHYATNLE